jgi:hypothetical protein
LDSLKDEVQAGVELLTSLTSSILHTSITSSSSSLNLQVTDVNKERKLGEELLAIMLLVDTLNPIKNFPA